MWYRKTNVILLYFGKVLNSAVDTRFIHPTYPSATCSSKVPYGLDNVAVREITVVLVLQKLTQTQVKYINVQYNVKLTTART